ncbi:hypothetical protein PG989_015395 [Apiospora arundinis]
MQELTQPDPTVYSWLMGSLLHSTLAAVRTVPNDEDTQLFCVGMTQLIDIVAQRFGVKYPALAKLRAFIRNSQLGNLWDSIKANSAEQLRLVCRDNGVQQGDRSLVALNSDPGRILAVDHAAGTMRLIDADLLVLRRDLHGCIRAPPGHAGPDIIMPIDGSHALEWWLENSGEVETD